MKQYISLEDSAGLTIECVDVSYADAVIVFTNGEWTYLAALSEDDAELDNTCPGKPVIYHPCFVKLGIVDQSEAEAYNRERMAAAQKRKEEVERAEYQRLHAKYGAQ